MKKLYALAYYYWYAVIGRNIDTPIWTNRKGELEAFIFNNKNAADMKVMSATMAGNDTEHTNGGRLHTVIVKPRKEKEPEWTPRRRWPIEFSLN